MPPDTQNAVAPPPDAAVTPPCDGVDEQFAETAFVLWVAAAGDMATVARQLHMGVPEVRIMSRRGGWDRRARGLARIGDIGDLEPADFAAAQVALNRGINFTQAHRLRMIADRALVELGGAGSIMGRFTDDKGTVDTKPLVDIARVVELSQKLTAQALGDLAGAGIRPPGPRNAPASARSGAPSTGRAAISVGRAMSDQQEPI